MADYKILIAKSLNPYLNLAVENWLLNNLKPTIPVLYLWQNNKTVVIGRHQNVYAECDVEKAITDGINIARRQSGGGAVYHDLGNLNFTFLSAKNNFSVDKNNQVIIKALGHFGIKAETSGRNDLIVNDAKISGAAFKIQADRAFHHGTLLVNLNLENAAKYLTPDKSKLEAKGVTSIKARIANLIDFNPTIKIDDLIMAIAEKFGNTNFEYLSEENLENNSQILEYYNLISSHDWIFNKKPSGQKCIKKKTDKGFFEIYFNLNQNKCVDVKVFSDALNLEEVEAFRLKVEGAEFSESFL